MKKRPKKRSNDESAALRAKIKELRAQLREANETLEAIRSGEVDALVVGGPAGEQVYTLTGAERVYRVLVEQMQEGAATCLRDGTILYSNRRLAVMLNMPMEKVVGTSIQTLVAPAERPGLAKMLDGVTAGILTFARAELTLQAAGGTTVPVYLSVNVIRPDEAPILCVVVTDLTERKAAEVALKRSHDELEQLVDERTAQLGRANGELQVANEELQTANEELQTTAEELHQQNDELLAARAALEIEQERYRDLFELAPDAYAVTDPKGAILEANRATAALFHTPETALLGTALAAFVVSAERDAFAECLAGLRSGKGSGTWETVLWARDGTKIPAFVSVNATFDSSGKPATLRWLLRDITDRKRVEEAVEAARADAENEKRRLEVVMAALPVGIAITDAQGGNIRSNSTFESVWGGTRPATHSVPDYARYKAWWADTGKPVQSEEWASARAVRDGETVVGQLLEIERFDGTRVYVINSAAPVRDSAGQLVGSVVAIQDVTALKRTEEALQAAAAELARSNEDLEQFAYVASHDLQEPLRQVTGHMQLLKKRYAPKLDADAAEFIAFALDGATRMSQLINDLLAYSRVGSRGKEPEPTDSNQVMKDVLAGLELVIEDNHAVVTHDPLPTVRADATHLAQLFQNLIGNAIKFHGDQPPRVHVGVQRTDDGWQFSVADNGIGVEPRQFDRIFMVFQRLHAREKYPGTGIGLAICKRIVERQGGRIWVESKPGEGATFHFTLPAVDG